jgi:hypothetical protein
MERGYAETTTLEMATRAKVSKRELLRARRKKTGNARCLVADGQHGALMTAPHLEPVERNPSTRGVMNGSYSPPDVDHSNLDWHRLSQSLHRDAH